MRWLWTIIKNFSSWLWTIVRNLITNWSWKKVISTLSIVVIPTILLYLGIFDGVAGWQFSQQRYRILVPLEATSREYLDFIESKTVPTIGENDYSSRTSRNFRNIIEASKNSWFTDNGKEAEYLSNRIDFYYFPEGFDNGYEKENDSYERAFNKAKEIADSDEHEIIGLIGNISSTTTLKYAEFCGKERIAMILPLATATNLMNNIKVKGVSAAIRLPPANNKQTQIISSFLREIPTKKLTRSIILKDLTNPVYSNDLVDGFRESYVQSPLKTYIERTNDEPNVKHEDDFGRILGVIPIGRDSSPFLYPNLNELQAESLLFFGMTDPTLETLAQAKANKLNYEQIILTDGSVDEYLLERIEGIVEKNNQTKIHLVFPLSCPLPIPLNEIMDKKGYAQKLEMTHGIYIADSAYLMLGIVKSNTERSPSFYQYIWRWIRGNDVKYYVGKTIENWRESVQKNKSPKKLEIKFKSVSSDENDRRSYLIDELGNTVELDYHVFQIKRIEGKLKSILFWEHDNDCPIEKSNKVSLLKCVEPPITVQETKK